MSAVSRAKITVMLVDLNYQQFEAGKTCNWKISSLDGLGKMTHVRKL